MDFLIPLALSVLFETLKVVVKNATKKEALAKAMKKLRDALLVAYPLES